MAVKHSANVLRIMIVLVFASYVYGQIKNYMLYGGEWYGMSPHFMFFSILPILSFLFIYNSASKLAKIDEDNFIFYMLIQNKDEKLASAFRLLKLGAFFWLIPLFKTYFVYLKLLINVHYIDHKEIFIWLGFNTLSNILPILIFYMASKVLKKGRGLIFNIAIFIVFYVLAVGSKIVFFQLGQPIEQITLIYYAVDFLLFSAFTMLWLNFYMIIREYE